MNRPKYIWPFHTRFGWIAIAGNDRQVSLCTLGHPSREAALRRCSKVVEIDLVVRDWNPRARRQLSDYAAGKLVSFDDIALDLEGVPDFHRAVLEACRAIPYGATLSYAKLAAAAGRPRAVRAAGTAMARNRLPILIPCHRVVRSDGGLGGYSCPQGVGLKRRLLAMEAVGVKLDGINQRHTCIDSRSIAAKAREIRIHHSTCLMVSC